MLVIYQREPHAGQMGFEHIVQPRTMEERLQLARSTRRETQLPVPFLVDSMKDESRALFSDLPSPAILIDPQGLVLEKWPWAEADVIQSFWRAHTAPTLERPKTEPQEGPTGG